MLGGGEGSGRQLWGPRNLLWSSVQGACGAGDPLYLQGYRRELVQGGEEQEGLCLRSHITEAERCCVPGPAQGVTWVLSLATRSSPHFTDEASKAYRVSCCEQVGEL